tara:strand:- start:3813 stop:5168 length:1356 start_codon:yes stop_codon:yes gene_type:complete
MGILQPGSNQKKSMRRYYDQLKKDRYGGKPRNYLPSQTNVQQQAFAGRYTGLRRQGRGALILGGLYLLGSFRSIEPRLFTAGKYLVAPVINTTVAGKALKTATNALRTAQQLGVLPTELTNTYADIPVNFDPKKPFERITSIFKDKGLQSKDVRKRYGLLYGDDRSHDSRLLDTATAGGVPDLIPILFKGFDAAGDEVMVPMRGMIAGLSDTVTPTWNETMYVGRPQGVVSYGGFTREIAFDLTVAAVAGKDLRPMWKRINKLAEFVLPQSDGDSGFRFAGRLCKVTIGNYLDDELCAMTSMAITPNEEMMWEIEDPEIHHDSITLTPPIGAQLREAVQRKINKGREKKVQALEKANASEEEVQKVKSKIKKFPKTRKERRKLDAKGEGNGYTRFVMPRVCTISIGLKVLHNRVPGADDNNGGLFNVNESAGLKKPTETPGNPETNLNVFG